MPENGGQNTSYYPIYRNFDISIYRKLIFRYIETLIFSFDKFRYVETFDTISNTRKHTPLFITLDSFEAPPGICSEQTREQTHGGTLADVVPAEH